jgi:predicted DNA-binding WGR domain protein
MIRLTHSDPSRNMHRFYAMQLGNWVTNPAPGQAANLARSVIKNTEHR